MTPRPTTSDVPAAIDAIGAGEFLVVCDDERSGGGTYLMMAADRAAPEAVASMVRHTTGLVCVAITSDRAQQLELPPMVDPASASPGADAFTVSVDLSGAVGSGMSSSDRAATVVALADPRRTASDFARPGHVFPLRSEPGGVLARPRATEAVVDLARLAGREPAGVFAALVAPDGAILDRESAVDLATDLGVGVIDIAELVHHRYRHEHVVDRFSSATIPTRHGPFVAHAYRSRIDEQEHVALVHGELETATPLVRVHSECLTGDVFGSRRCDCGPQLDRALAAIAASPGGVMVYLRGHEGRGIGLGHKLAAYALQDQGHDTVDANLALGLPVDAREYGIGAQILADLGVRRLRLLTNNPVKQEQLRRYGIDVVERVPLDIPPTPENLHYLQTKQARLGHLIEIADQP